MSISRSGKPHSVLLAIPDSDELESVRFALDFAGFRVVGACVNGQEAIDLAVRRRPSVVLVDYLLPRVDGVAVATQLARRRVAPSILLATDPDRELLDLVGRDGVYGLVAKPIREQSIVPAIEVAVARWQDTLEAARRLERLQGQNASRDAIGDAKRLLMNKLGLNERDAFRRIQTSSMSTRRTMGQVAEAILIADGAVSGRAWPPAQHAAA